MLLRYPWSAPFRIGGEGLKQEWSDFLTEVQDLQRERNRVTHDLWTMVQLGDGSFALQRVRLRLQKGEVIPDQEVLPISHVFDVAQRASDLFVRLLSLIPRLEADGALYPTGLGSPAAPADGGTPS